MKTNIRIECIENFKKSSIADTSLYQTKWIHIYDIESIMPYYFDGKELCKIITPKIEYFTIHNVSEVSAMIEQYKANERITTMTTEILKGMLSNNGIVSMSFKQDEIIKKAIDTAEELSLHLNIRNKRVYE